MLFPLVVLGFLFAASRSESGGGGGDQREGGGIYIAGTYYTHEDARRITGELGEATAKGLGGWVRGTFAGAGTGGFLGGVAGGATGTVLGLGAGSVPLGTVGGAFGTVVGAGFGATAGAVIDGTGSFLQSWFEQQDGD